MYKSSFVASIKVNNQFLKEEGEVVRIPFGTEYSIFMHNLDGSRKVVVEITIDGDSVTDSGIVVFPDKPITLERAIDGNLNSGRRFKFIERTAGIESYRGIKPDDGIIRIKFTYERIVQSLYSTTYVNYRASSGTDAVDRFNLERSVISNSDYSAGGFTTANINNQYESTKCSSDVGITGKGSSSEQKFIPATVGSLESVSDTIIFKLLGEIPVDGNFTKLEKPIVEKYSKICHMCGRKYASRYNYCSDDGNALEFLRRYVRG